MASASEKNSPVWLKRSLRFIINAFVPLLIVAGAMGFYKYQMNTRPQAQRRPVETQALRVRVQTVKRQTRPVVIEAMGTVRAAKEVTLSPEVAGVIVAMDAAVVPGGRVHKGQVLYRIDARDYESVVEQYKSQLAGAELALTLEQASQTVARQEYALLGDIIDEQDRLLVLRKPQLENARQTVAAAQAALAKAELDVSRCTITAPFDAIIKTKHVDIGARVSPASALATLTGTDEYWVETLIPVGQLGWLRLPDGQGQGSLAKVYNVASRNARQGRLIQLLGQLEEAGRMAQALVSVPDPLGRGDNTERLLIGAYVRVDLEGAALPDVVALPRDYVRDGQSVWVMNEKDQLEIRPVQIAFRGREAVYITDGLNDGCRVIISDLAAPAAGMPLRLDAHSTGAPQ